MESTEFTLKDFIQDNFQIRNKDFELVSLKFNPIQNKFYEKFRESYGNRPSRFIVLKARQLGFSTLTEALITGISILTPNTNSIIMAHQADAASAIFGMTKLYYDSLPQGMRPAIKNSNAKELVFDNETGTGLKSAIRIMVASDSARGSTYKLAHLSEVAFWQDADTALLALNQAIPMTNDSLVVVESTANGFNRFYNLWDDAVNGRNDYIPIFFAWYEDPNYSKPYDGFELTAYEKDIKEKFNLTNDQLQWRRWCIANNCGGDEVKFRQEYPITPEEAFIVSGSQVFNSEIILEHMKALKKPIKVGYFSYDYIYTKKGPRIENIKWVDDKSGFIKIYKEPNGTMHSIGGDTAGEGSDFFVGQVVDRNGYQCATLHQKFDTDQYTYQMYCLGVYYDYSKIAIEANFDSLPNRELQKLHYPNLYVRENYDQMLEDKQERFGFKTTSVTRPLIISQLQKIAREQIGLINDRETLQEMLSFVKNKHGRPEASQGTHDDLVMGLAIAYEALHQLPPESKKTKRKEKVEEENFFDYGM